jgi:hypothetical protein
MKSFACGNGRMNTVVRIMAGSVATVVGFAQTAISGNYSTTPVVEDSGSDAGVFLLLAVGALIVIGGLAKPKPPAEPSVDAPDITE